MTLGQLLQNKRLELGRSVEQISAATKIHVKILIALERDQYSELPARAFTRGFIVTYCKALHLDSNEILQQYHDFLISKFAERDDRDRGHQGYVFEGKELEQNKRGLIIGASVAAVFAIAVILIFKPQNHHRKEKHKEFVEESTPNPTTDENAGAIEPNAEESIAASAAPATPAVASTVSAASSPVVTAVKSPVTSPVGPSVTPSVAFTAPATTPSPAAIPSVSPSPSLSPTPKPDKLNKGDDLGPKEASRRILFTALEDVWVKYKIDSKPAMTIVLRKGRQLVVKAKTKLEVETSNPAALQYKTRTNQFGPLPEAAFEVQTDGAIQPISPGSVAPGAFPVSVPPQSNP